MPTVYGYTRVATDRQAKSGGRLYGYIRVSTQEQARSGLSLAAQRRQIEVCANRLRLKVARIFRDAAVSASKTPMLRRAAGQELYATAKAGDHIAIAKLDRAFRSLQDFSYMLDRWQRRGVLVHILDIGVDTSSPVGRLIAGIIAAVAEWESRRIGERIRDAHAERRAQGRKTNGTVAIGYRATRGKIVRPDEAERKIARRILRLRRAGATWEDIAARLNRERVWRRGKSPWAHDSAMRWGTAATHRFPITGWHGIANDRRRFRQRW
jgi:putative DNA-invertase from lambdoid prophage Rac